MSDFQRSESHVYKAELADESTIRLDEGQILPNGWLQGYVPQADGSYMKVWFPPQVVRRVAQVKGDLP